MNRPLHFELESLTAEDDRVSFEGVGSGEFKNGAEFKNFYHILMTIRNGKIVRGRAYFDTYTASRSPLQSSLDESQKLR
jgi:ketosteroid isomerase-like protein